MKCNSKELFEELYDGSGVFWGFVENWVKSDRLGAMEIVSKRLEEEEGENI